MKKITTLFLIIFAICLLTACRAEPATEPQTLAPTETAPSVSPENTAITLTVIPTVTPTPTQPTETISPEPVDTSYDALRVRIASTKYFWRFVIEKDSEYYHDVSAEDVLNNIRLNMTFAEVHNFLGGATTGAPHHSEKNPFLMYNADNKDELHWYISCESSAPYRLIITFENNTDPGGDGYREWLKGDRIKTYVFPEVYGHIPKVISAEIHDYWRLELEKDSLVATLTEEGWVIAEDWNPTW